MLLLEDMGGFVRRSEETRRAAKGNGVAPSHGIGTHGFRTALCGTIGVGLDVAHLVVGAKALLDLAQKGQCGGGTGGGLRGKAVDLPWREGPR